MFSGEIQNIEFLIQWKGKEKRIRKPVFEGKSETGSRKNRGTEMQPGYRRKPRWSLRRPARGKAPRTHRKTVTRRETLTEKRQHLHNGPTHVYYRHFRKGK